MRDKRFSSTMATHLTTKGENWQRQREMFCCPVRSNSKSDRRLRIVHSWYDARQFLRVMTVTRETLRLRQEHQEAMLVTKINSGRNTDRAKTLVL